MSKLMLAAAAALLIAAPAFAAPAPAADGAPTQQVSTRGVDFTNKGQVKQFYARLNGAASSVCGGDSFSATDLSCQRQAVAAAVKVANKPVLTAMYDQNQSAVRAFAGNDQ